MAGQNWPEGDSTFYGRLRVPILLICGCQDKLVPEEEEEETLYVSHQLLPCHFLIEDPVLDFLQSLADEA